MCRTHLYLHLFSPFFAPFLINYTLPLAGVRLCVFLLCEACESKLTGNVWYLFLAIFARRLKHAVKQKPTNKHNLALTFPQLFSFYFCYLPLHPSKKLYSFWNCVPFVRFHVRNEARRWAPKCCWLPSGQGDQKAFSFLRSLGKDNFYLICCTMPCAITFPDGNSFLLACSVFCSDKEF